MFEQSKNFSSNPNIINVMTPDQGSSQREQRPPVQDSELPNRVLLSGDEIAESLRPRKMNKLKKVALIGMGSIGTAGVLSIALFAGLKSSEATDVTTVPDNDPAGTSEVEGGTAPEVVPLPTYQDEIAKGLEARAAEMPVSIPVEGRAVTAEDAIAWVAAREACIDSGSIPISSYNSASFIASLGSDPRGAISEAFQLDANWEKCTSNIISANPNAAEIYATGKDLNEAIVQHRLYGREVTMEYVDQPEINVINETTISIGQKLNRTVVENGTPNVSEGFSGGTLQVENGVLKLVGPVTN